MIFSGCAFSSCAGDVSDPDRAKCDIGLVKRLRATAFEINHSMRNQSNDRQQRFAQMGLREAAKPDSSKVVVRVGDIVAVAFVVSFTLMISTAHTGYSSIIIRVQGLGFAQLCIIIRIMAGSSRPTISYCG